ncbi:Alcohol dehydrogenase superfamily, zinc-type [Metarhizium album ARSEF 1941]|uniref:Alcohol dehydrogenase superfamily, zinc-type n=1 Tax=Metarhizium album (strain ARSEF 1941) TaxID=1081103 RepID=A0A0B2WTQ0_METAS|nr:Alcohol dehydrogenase superfamily, zinc-type [Metarhizium album ARSEF 1941]KHN97428.1 Alcohol dehydrogenase superfamily, zinc-type [Metarhizium album ARSEF 1941]
MKAIQVTGSKDSHQIVLNVAAAKPSPQQDQVLVKVHAAGITADEVTWPELYSSSTRIPGHDISGVVEALGPDYAGPLEIGDQVFAMLKAMSDAGGQAEYVVASPEEAAAKPTSVSHARAAALPVPFLTAWEAIYKHANVRKGGKVLVTGASGAVGLMLVQIAAKVLHCHVVALASARKHLRLKSLGAAVLVDYRWPAWEDSVMNIDAVFDTVGGETLSKAWKCVKPNASIVTVADPPPPWAFGRATPQELKEHPDVKWVYFVVASSGAILLKLTRLLDEGKLAPIPVKSFGIEDGLKAWDYAGRRDRDGKAVIEFARSSG